MKYWAAVLALALLGACATPRTGVDATCRPDYVDVTGASPQHDFAVRGENLVLRAIPNREASDSILGAIDGRLDAIFRQPPNQREYRALLLSTGGAWGAFGSGYLTGLAERGALPEYDLVTGASTGAIIAPFAFLGRYGEANEVYRTLTDDRILTRRSTYALLRANSLFDNRRMRDFILTELRERELVEAIAAERLAHPHRVLAVIAVNVDTGQTEAFDLAAIAAERTDIEDRRSRIADRILASAAIPLAFEPVMMNGCMYLDAGLRQHLFMTGELVAAVTRHAGADVIERIGPNGREFVVDLGGYSAAEVTVRVDAVVNGAARIEPRVTPSTVTQYGLRPIALRALPILMNQSTWASIDRAAQVGRVLNWTMRYRDAADFPGRDTGSAFSLSGPVFDPAFMIALSDHGYGIGFREGDRAWRRIPGSTDIVK